MRRLRRSRGRRIICAEKRECVRWQCSRTGSQLLHGHSGEEAQREVFTRERRSAADAFAEEHGKAGALVAGTGKEFVGIPALSLRERGKVIVFQIFGVGVFARIEAGEEGLRAEKAFELFPCALRGIALPVEEGEIPPKIAEPRVEFALFHFLAAEFFGKAGIEAGNGGVLCDLFGRKRAAELFRLPPAEFAQEVDVPIVFDELMHALFALFPVHIIVDEGMKGAVRRVVGDIAEDIGKGARAVLVRIDGEAGVLWLRCRNLPRLYSLRLPMR